MLPRQQTRPREHVLPIQVRELELESLADSGSYRLHYRAWTAIYTLLSYTLVPALLLVSLVLHEHFKDTYHALISSSVVLALPRAGLWLLAALCFLVRLRTIPSFARGTKLSALLLSSMCLIAAGEEIHWSLAWQWPSLSEPGDSWQLHNELTKQLGIDSVRILAFGSALYSVALPFLLLVSPHRRKRLGAGVLALPTPRISVLFLIATSLTLLPAEPLCRQMAITLFPICFLLTACTPASVSLRFPAPDGAGILLLAIGLASFSVPLIEPTYRAYEARRFAEAEHALLQAVLIQDNEAISRALRSEDRQQFLERSPIIATAIQTGAKEFVDSLLQLGANPNSPDTNGQTPLEVAIQRRSLELVLSLLWRKADPNFKSPSGSTALLSAIRTQQLSILDLLLEYKADPTLHDSKGRVPIIEAARIDFLPGVQRLIAAGASVDSKDSAGETPLQASPSDSLTRAMLTDYLLDREEQRAKAQVKALLAVAQAPSMVWDSEGERSRLLVLSLVIRNYGQEVATGVRLYLIGDDGATFDLVGPDTIAAEGQATFVSTSTIEATEATLKLIGGCTECSSNLEMSFSDW